MLKYYKYYYNHISPSLTQPNFQTFLPKIHRNTGNKDTKKAKVYTDLAA